MFIVKSYILLNIDNVKLYQFSKITKVSNIFLVDPDPDRIRVFQKVGSGSRPNDPDPDHL